MSTSVLSSRTGGDTRKPAWCEERVPGGRTRRPSGKPDGKGAMSISSRSSCAATSPFPTRGCPCRSHLHGHPPPMTWAGSISPGQFCRDITAQQPWIPSEWGYYILPHHFLGTWANENQKKNHPVPCGSGKLPMRKFPQQKICQVVFCRLDVQLRQRSSLSPCPGRLPVVIARSGPSSDSPSLTLGHSTNLSWLFCATCWEQAMSNSDRV